MQLPSSEDITPPIMKGKYWIITSYSILFLTFLRWLETIYPNDLILYTNEILDWSAVFIFFVTTPIMIIPWNNLTSAIRFYRSGGESDGVYIDTILSNMFLTFVYVILYKIPYIGYLFLCLEFLNLLTLMIILRYRSRIKISLLSSFFYLILASRLFYQGFGTYWLL